MKEPNTDKWEEMKSPESMEWIRKRSDEFLVKFLDFSIDQEKDLDEIFSFIKSLLTEQEARVKEELIKEWLEETSEKPFNPNLSKQ